MITERFAHSFLSLGHKRKQGQAENLMMTQLILIGSLNLSIISDLNLHHLPYS